MNQNYILITNKFTQPNPTIHKLLMYILLDTDTGNFIITNFKIKPNPAYSAITDYNIEGEERKELLELFHLKNIINTFNKICKESFLTIKDTTRRVGEIPLFGVSGINTRGQQEFSYRGSVKARPKLNSHELTRNHSPRKVKKLFSSSSTKKNRFKVKSLDPDRVRTVLESRKIRRRSTSLKQMGDPEMDEGDVNIGVLIITMHGSIPYYRKDRFNKDGIPFVKIKPERFPNVYYRSSTKVGLYSFYDKPHPNSPLVSPTNDSDDDYEYVNQSRLSQVTSHIQRNAVRFSHKNKRNIYEKCFKQTHNKLKFYKYFFNCGLDFLGKYKKSLRDQRRRPDGYKITTLYDEEKDEKRYLEDIVDNGKVDYIINKNYTNDPDTPDGEKDTQHKLKFIFYNTSTKRYEKYNLIDEDDFIKFCHIFGIDMNNQMVKIYLSKIKNENNVKRISTVFVLNILSFLKLNYLYIYDETCSVYEIEPMLIQYYTEVAEPRMTISEIDEEITRELYEEIQLKMEEENKKVGI